MPVQIFHAKQWSCLLYTSILVWIFTDPFVAAFNSENNLLLLKYAHTGLRLYFLGFLFAGVNIMLVAYFSATANARPAIIGSLLRLSLIHILLNFFRGSRRAITILSLWIFKCRIWMDTTQHR